MRFKGALKVFCLAVVIVLTFVALGPARWQPRSGLGWEIDHFAGYFLITVMFCLAWPRPLIVGGALAVFAVVLGPVYIHRVQRTTATMLIIAAKQVSVFS